MSNSKFRVVKGARLNGYLDGIFGRDLCGWAISPDGLHEAAVLNVCVDGRKVGQVVADQYREDLQSAGVGNGHHAFRFHLPATLFDGQEHDFAIENSGGTQQVIAEGRYLLEKSAISGGIAGITYNRICGRISDPLSPGIPIEFSIEVDGKRVLEGKAEEQMPDGAMGFALALDTSLSDGAPHTFALVFDGQVLAAAAFIVPFINTPADILSAMRGGALVPQLDFTSRSRYAALSQQIDRLSAEGNAGKLKTRLQNLSAIHRWYMDGGLQGKTAPGDFPAFSFAPVRAPKASVLIPVHNQFAYTYNCLASLYLMPNQTEFEILILDDASSDQTCALTELIGGVKVIRNETALGFLRNCNQGAKKARGEYLVFLNNDTELTPNWLDHLLRPFAIHDDVGLVGSKLIFGDGRLQEAGGMVWRNGQIENFGRNGNPRDPRYCYLRDVATARVPASPWRGHSGKKSAASTKPLPRPISRIPILPFGCVRLASASSTSPVPR